MKQAIDFANYTTVPSPATVAALRAAGYVRAIVGCSYGSVAPAQLAACIAGGMETEAYAWISAEPDWRTPLDHALTAIAGTPVARLWLDYEEPALTEVRLREVLRYVVSIRPDLRLGIYTSASRWAGVSGDYTRYPLWLASYTALSGEGTADAAPNRAPPWPPPGGGRLFGGWTSAAMWQYRGSTTVCGFANVDLSLILSDENTIRPGGGETREDRMYTDAQIDEKLVRAIAAARDAANQSSNMATGNVLKTLAALGERLSALEAKAAAAAPEATSAAMLARRPQID